VSQIANYRGITVSIDDLKNFVQENSFKNSKGQEFFVVDALLGDGSKLNPVAIMMTSRTCLNYIRDKAACMHWTQLLKLIIWDIRS